MKKTLQSIMSRISAAANAVDEPIHPEHEENPYTDFKQSREFFYKKDLRNAVNELKTFSLDSLDDDIKARLKPLIDQLKEDYEQGRRMLMLDLLKRIKPLVDNLPEKEKFSLDVPKLPEEIRSEITADIREIEKTFQAECYRSVTILCGRILEVALHRKYFEVTGNDILETSPGIGLGKLIAKLKEKDVHFDPGITEQIHLVNQVRVNSVHVKQQMFNPTKEQSYAMILYALDVLKKLF